MLQWTSIEPILRRTYELMESSGRTTGQAVMGDLGIDDNEARSAFDALTRSGYITVEQESASGIPFIVAPSRKGLERCAGWPPVAGASTFMAVFLDVIQARADDEAVPTEDRSRFAQFAKAAGAVGKDALTEIAAKVITSGYKAV
jgi:hypothetical protein